ncbi:hypothetical protein Ct9H90mP29_23470 [bacterium]|nr:MAG: hypothetical protein Ct9H90mP29_23470 [bacterium]
MTKGGYVKIMVLQEGSILVTSNDSLTSLNDPNNAILEI